MTRATTIYLCLVVLHTEMRCWCQKDDVWKVIYRTGWQRTARALALPIPLFRFDWFALCFYCSVCVLLVSPLLSSFEPPAIFMYDIDSESFCFWFMYPVLFSRVICVCAMPRTKHLYCAVCESHNDISEVFWEIDADFILTEGIIHLQHIVYPPVDKQCV